ncbi:CoA-transferase [Streptomyces sp. NPDC002896]|uniref:CoA-transferase n=1 Tax=Streptomyces sp. NPDC002896 TaxID=3154438 RepID=UPI003326AB01
MNPDRNAADSERGPLDKHDIAALVARDIPHGAFVNLGIGQPTLVADHLPADSGVVLHTENAMLNMGPAAQGDEIDCDLTNAGKVPMDLAIGTKKVFVVMTLFTKTGAPKLVPRCTYPLTGLGCVDRIYTDLAVFDITPQGVSVRQTCGTTVDELAARLDLPLLPVPT